jgi:type IV secretory pathway VirB10-like protein
LHEPIKIQKEGLLDVSPIIDTIHSDILKMDRQIKALNKNKQEILSNKTTKIKQVYIFKDDNYNKLNIGSNLFTFPVDRDRMLTREIHIGGILEDSINSQIPGRVRILIDQDVLNVSMKKILFPYYTRVVCDYEGLARTGQTRLLVNCSEIIRPDGSRVRMKATRIGDVAGNNGLIGKVDNRIWQMYSSAFLVASITALAQVSESRIKNDAIAQKTNDLSNQFGQITSKILEKNTDLRPVMRIEAGTRVILKPEKDFVFPEPIVKDVDLQNNG